MIEHLTEIVYLLDRSGSMASMQIPAVAAFNDFVKSQQDVPGLARLTLVQFSSHHETSIGAQQIREVEPLNSARYTPMGRTALLDAIADTIREVDFRLNQDPDGGRLAKVIFAIFTDGLENASTRHTSNQVSDLINDHRSLKGWEFIFLAANQEAIATACAMGMDRRHSSGVEFSAEGLGHSSRALHRRIRSLRMEKEGLLDEQAKEDGQKSLNDIILEESQKGE